MKRRISMAACSCGNLSIECSGEPDSVSLCSCLDCQRRTGSAFGIAAFFRQAQTRVQGAPSCYPRTSENGFEFFFYFCPRCGNTVYWQTSRKPGFVAVAGGAFADPGFPAPTTAHHADRQQPWLRFSLE